uniref:Uncharacterized protein n=1 Tax=Anguilla anguilla TaxID=7936 RepID=A0A0E9UZU0_ANGAN
MNVMYCPTVFSMVDYALHLTMHFNAKVAFERPDA